MDDTYCSKELLFPLNFKTAITVIIFGIIGAICGAYATTLVNVETLKICFGLFLIIIGTYQLYKSVTKPKYEYYNKK